MVIASMEWGGGGVVRKVWTGASGREYRTLCLVTNLTETLANQIRTLLFCDLSM